MDLVSMRRDGTSPRGDAFGGVNSPEEPLAATEQNPLATSFEMLSQEQLFANDVERSEDFRWAALALRMALRRRLCR